MAGPAVKGAAFNELLASMVNFASIRRVAERNGCAPVWTETGDTAMLFGLFQATPTNDDDIATGTYADGVVGTPLSDASARPRDRSQPFRRTAHERDYGTTRAAGQTGAGMIP